MACPRWLLALTVAFAACGDETGVLLVIDREAETTPGDIETLEIRIGAGRSEGGLFLENSASLRDLRLGGRDLASDPFELFVEAGEDKERDILVAVIARRGDETVGFAGFTDPQTFKEGQVLRKRLTLVHDDDAGAGATGCITWNRPGTDEVHVIASLDDHDCDLDPVATDCNDEDPTVGTNQNERCGNDVDDDCDGDVDEEVDEDRDGFSNCDDDCDDDDPAVFPGAEELCDGVDNNCDAGCDEGFDGDDDDYTTCGFKRLQDDSCAPDAEPDCDDGDAEVNPGALEACNGIDDDCDGQCDPPGDFDVDMDELSECGSVPGVCSPATPALADCDDTNPEVRPGLNERCDGVDTNCDGVRLAEEPCYADDSGTCRLGSRSCDDEGGDAGLAACQVGGGDLAVLGAFCEAYDECEQTMAPDLFECANDSVTTDAPTFTCKLAWKAVPAPALCPERRFALTEGEGQDCQWNLLGGKRQRHFEAGLAAGPGEPGGTSDVCDSDLVIVDKLDFVPQPDVFTLLRTGGGGGPGPQPLRFSIEPELVQSCPQNGLTCTISP